MRNLCIFENNKLGEIRIVEKKKNELLFCSDDIFKILKNRNKEAAIKKYCSHGIVLNNVVVVVKNEFGNQLSIEHSENYITYEDAIMLIGSTNGEDALALERWLYIQIFPLIKQHGLHNASLVWNSKLMTK